MPTLWLRVLSIGSLAVAAICAMVIAGDIAVGRRQKMAVMNVTWPLTALYLGPFALWAYLVFGRAQSHDPEETEAIDRPRWQSVFVGVTHCGGGCALGDVVGEWMVFSFGWTIAGKPLWADYLTDFVLAYIIGIGFQYAAIAPMQDVPPWKAIQMAIKADTLSLIAFEAGMFAWMAIVDLVLFHPQLRPTEPTYWLMMQFAMAAGFATSFPMNWWLIKNRIKKAM